MQHTLDALLRRVPSLELPLGRVQAILTPALVLGVVLALILWVGSLTPLGGLMLALLAMGASAWLALDLLQAGEERPYEGALFYGVLPLAGLHGAVLLSLPWTGGEDLFPAWLSWPLFFYLLLTGLVLLARSLAEASGPRWLLLDDSAPVGALHETLRHPALGGLGRLALALGVASGSAMALLVAVVYAAVLLPRWAAALDACRRQPTAAPSLWPAGVLDEARLLASLIDPLHPGPTLAHDAVVEEDEYALDPEFEPVVVDEPAFADEESGDFPDEDSSTEVIVAKEEE